MSSSIEVQMRSISRTFGSVVALDSVDFAAPKGEITAIVGENGAGKTTLMRILYGAERADRGSVEINGTAVTIRSTADGLRHGIGMVSQHYSIIPQLSCLENLILGEEPGMFLSRAKAAERAESLASKMGFQFEWERPASELSPAGAQKLEILKLLWRNSQIMILDEPTAMLSPSDSDALFESLKKLAHAGATIIVVTHRLPEVLQHCQTVAVLRMGRLVQVAPVEQTNASQLAEWIVGKSLDKDDRPMSTHRGETALEVVELTVRGYRGDLAVRNASLELKQGEILGIAGVDGSGQRELFHAIAGHERPSSGRIVGFGSDWIRLSPSKRLQCGLRIVPEDRHEEGVVEAWTLLENAMIGLQSRPEFSRGGWIRVQDRHGIASSMADRFATKRESLNSTMASLSGGNQQRFVAGRALELEPKLILAFQPARGLDIEATRRVYEGIAYECARGAAALVVSFDLDELLDHCDRVVAMNRGTLYDPPKGFELDRMTIGKLMVATS